jgi:hypothetical protein
VARLNGLVLVSTALCFRGDSATMVVSTSAYEAQWFTFYLPSQPQVRNIDLAEHLP